MKTILRLFFVSFLLAFPAVCPLVTAGPVPECPPILNAEIRQSIKILRRLENHYVHYRWVETRIRDLAYNSLWMARRNAMDPFSKSNRSQGRDEEVRILEVLAVLEKKSLRHSNAFAADLLELQNSFLKWKKSCPEKAFADCISESFQTADEWVRKIRTEFEHTFEREREFRNAVLLTAGGREGLYPEDAVEVPAKHGDYYWRFEAEREAARFKEDAIFRNFTDEIRKILTWDNKIKKCCLRC